jgi:hypothetical protein
VVLACLSVRGGELVKTIVYKRYVTVNLSVSPWLFQYRNFVLDPSFHAHVSEFYFSVSTKFCYFPSSLRILYLACVSIAIVSEHGKLLHYADPLLYPCFDLSSFYSLLPPLHPPFRLILVLQRRERDEPEGPNFYHFKVIKVKLSLCLTN